MTVLAHRKLLFELQEKLIEVFPERFDVKLRSSGTFMISTQEPVKSAIFTVEKAMDLLGIGRDDDVEVDFVKYRVDKVCYSIEVERLKVVMELFKFVKVPGKKYYQRPGREMKLWVSKCPASVVVTDHYVKQREEALTAESLVEILASSRFI